MAKCIIDPKTLVHHITLTARLKNWRWWKFRLRLGAWFIAAGCAIAGIGYEESHTE